MNDCVRSLEKQVQENKPEPSQSVAQRFVKGITGIFKVKEEPKKVFKRQISWAACEELSAAQTRAYSNIFYGLRDSKFNFCLSGQYHSLDCSCRQEDITVAMDRLIANDLIETAVVAGVSVYQLKPLD